MLAVPKSRVTIEYVKYTEGGKEKVQLPLKLLMLGDYKFKEPSPDDPLLAERELIDINQNNFSEQMKMQNIKLNFTVPNRLVAEEGEEMSVNLKIDDLNSFKPENIVKQVDELKKIMSVRDLLLALKSHVVSKRQFQQELERIVKTEDLNSVIKELAEGFSAGESKGESSKEPSS